MHEVGELFVCLYYLNGTKVNATQYDAWLMRRTDKGLEWGLSVELDSEVDDIAAFHQTIGWGISPTTSYVDTHRRTSPYDLVLVYRHPRLLFLCHHIGSQSLS